MHIENRLDPEQRSLIRQLHADVMILHGPPGLYFGKKEPMDDSFFHSTNQLLEILSEEQRTRWTKMIGKPFYPKVPFPFPK